MSTFATPPEPAPEEDRPAHGLLHRWLVQYNPLYLLSAALVLGGLTLVSREVARGALGALGVAAIAEVYALALIGGTAFLVRIAERRAAVMLALLVVLFQADLTLHVETCAYLGAIGRLAALAWVALFVVKLYALAWALELRLSRSAALVPALGAIYIAALPRLAREAEPETAAALVALGAFAVGAAGLWTSRAVTSAVPFDGRGVRSLRAAWAAWAVLGLGHVAYVCVEHGISLFALSPVAALLATRWLRREQSVWAAAGLAVAAAALIAPWLLSVTALMAGAALALRALRAPAAPVEQPLCEQPYRGALPIVRAPAFERASSAVMARLALGASAAIYLSIWTLGWSGGAWPAHQTLLDAAFTIACLIVAWRARRWLAAAPLAAVYAHFAMELGWLRTSGDLGLCAVASGFALLVIALSTSWRARRRGETSTPDTQSS